MPFLPADRAPHPEQAPAPQDRVLLVNDLSGGLDTITPLPLLPNAFCREADGVVFTEGAIQTDIDCVNLPLAIWDLPAAGDDYHILIPVDTLAAGPSQILLTTGGLYLLDSDGNPTVIHEGLKGDPKIRPSYTFMPSNDWLIITNGVDTPFYYDGTEVGFITSLSDTFGAFTARHVLSWNNLLFFIDTDEGGERRNYRIRRSDVADPTEWEEGLAGFTDLLDARDFVVGAKVLGPYLIIYRQRSLIRGEWIGLAHLLLDFNTVVPIDGPLNAEAIAQIDSTHIYAGRHGVYGYNGSLDVEHLSYPISARHEYPLALSQAGADAVRVFAGVNRRVVTIMLPQRGTEGAGGAQGAQGSQGPTPLTEASVGPGTEAGEGQCRLDDGTLYDLLVGECWIPIIVRNDHPPAGVVYKQGRPEIIVETARGEPPPPTFCEQLQGRHSGSPVVGQITVPLGYGMLDDGTFYKLSARECWVPAADRAGIIDGPNYGLPNFVFSQTNPEILRLISEDATCPSGSRGELAVTIRGEYVEPETPETPVLPPTTPNRTILYGVHIPKTSRLPVTWHKRTMEGIEYDDVGCYITTNPGVRWNELVGTWKPGQDSLTWNDYRGSIMDEKVDVFLAEDPGTACAYLRASMDRMAVAPLEWSCETGFFSAYERDLIMREFFMQYESSHPIMIEFLDTNAPDTTAPASTGPAIFRKSIHQDTDQFRLRFSGMRYAKITLYGVTFAENTQPPDTPTPGA